MQTTKSASFFQHPTYRHFLWQSSIHPSKFKDIAMASPAVLSSKAAFSLLCGPLNSLHGGSRASRLPCKGYSGVSVKATFQLQQTLGRRRVSIQAVPGMQTAVRSVPVQVANELCEAGHKYLDVRTPEEFAAGHVEGAVNVPYMFKHGPGMTTNAEFVQQVADIFDKSTELVVGCQSGKRSIQAVGELLAADFTNVTDVGGGFGAWKESGLPVHTL
eukprot:TRINITY_DN819_c0_g3_i1.p1 TRINITY_DN819_c0_g3~~TRINITY_DN819_c0_g3_i1.p1  ORF type:complete len:216 (+),score=20.92 TRINITY_DN819_c0_g3_i1:754-1401(+)